MDIDSARVLIDMISKDMGLYSDIVNVVGALYIGKIALSLLVKTVKYCRLYVKYSVNGTRSLVKQYGEWAVVTGASDGIGRAYAVELAKRGMNIVLISRTASKLQNVSEEIARLYGVKTEIAVTDFSKGYGAYEDVKKKLSELDVGILVNNVGVILEKPMCFIDMTEDEIKNHINVNIIPCSMITKIILPRMMERKKGAIVNIASTAALQPTPMFAVYSATKVYMDYFSQALQYECKDHNVSVQTLIPWFVNTKMVGYSKQLQNSWFVPNADKYARHAVRTLGIAERTTGYWLHDIIASIVSSTPPWLYKFLSVRGLKRLSKSHVM
ncbi:hydroxysteroid dehydrogenase-like protein 1 [Schistocerca gregaria]|uniref:hydroxysteroid dehydrogenase-like protein 1 n=1 Tax=Schistocerca gregaria TaxID=7010 RepID=UPI00211DF242|nr:hydroxysteroid dehydrogenase-like protein 1 [Schistocerca gregaria]